MFALFVQIELHSLDRMEKGRIILDDRERKRIKSNWNKIDMPLSLMCYPNFVAVKIGKFNILEK